MFSTMFDVIAWSFVVSVVVIAFAFASEGRGKHVLLVLLGKNPEGKGFDAVTSVPRVEGDWLLVPGSVEQAEIARRDVAASRH